MKTISESTSVTVQVPRSTRVEEGTTSKIPYEGCGVPTVSVKLDSRAHFQEWPWHVIN